MGNYGGEEWTGEDVTVDVWFLLIHFLSPLSITYTHLPD